MGTGTTGLMGVIVGAGTGGGGIAGNGAGGGVTVPGRCGGASADMLLVRSLTFESRALSACVVCACRPPAAGSMSSSQAPHWNTESTYTVLVLL